MKKVLFFIAAFFLALQVTCFAAITITSQTGTIKVTAPDGTVLTINAGDPIPAIADGSTIELVSGSVKVASTDNSTANVSIGGNTLDLTSGNNVLLSLDSTGVSSVSVLTGAGISLTTSDGKTATLDAGDDVSITGSDITVTAGSISVVGSDGKTVTLNAAGGNQNAEGYTPPDIQGALEIDTEVGSEESGKDVSPIK